MSHDSVMRAALLAELLSTYPMGRIVEEMGVAKGGAQVDIAVVTPTQLIGFELKSERDSFVRLPQQIKVYGTTFDRVTLIVEDDKKEVTCGRHVPQWWRLLRFTGKGFRVIREGSTNPASTTLGLLMLLWRDEKARLVRDLTSAKKAYKWNLNKLNDHLLASVPPEVLRPAALEVLIAREVWGRRDEYQDQKRLMELRKSFEAEANAVFDHRVATGDYHSDPETREQFVESYCDSKAWHAFNELQSLTPQTDLLPEASHA